jgi:hypothetical protein
MQTKNFEIVINITGRVGASLQNKRSVILNKRYYFVVLGGALKTKHRHRLYHLNLRYIHQRLQLSSWTAAEFTLPVKPRTS